MYRNHAPIRIILMLLLCAAGNAYSDLYAYTDADGVRHFTNIKPSDERYKRIIGNRETEPGYRFPSTAKPISPPVSPSDATPHPASQQRKSQGVPAAVPLNKVSPTVSGPEAGMSAVQIQPATRGEAAQNMTVTENFANVHPGKDFELDGFKDIKFGLSVDKLISMGFKCRDKYLSCDLESDANNTRTLFGQKTKTISLSYFERKVASVHVRIDITPDELIGLFTSSLGSPGTHNYVSLTGLKVKQYYWVSKNGTAIIVTKNLGSSVTKNIFGGIVPLYFSSAEYLNQAKTSEFLETVRKGAIDKNDF